jgi:hypothetical protein
MFTTIGSLPYKTLPEAERFVKRFIKNPMAIPAFPELPNLGDGMLQRIREPEKLSYLEIFKKQNFSRVKIQGPGPISLKPLREFSGDSDDRLVELSAKYLQTIQKGLIANENLISLDEPGMKEAPGGFQDLWEAIFSQFSNGEKREVHICGDSAPWSDILKIEWLDILNLDASLVDITIFPEYKIFRENGGIIAWGIKKEADIIDWRLGDLLTPVCGLSPNWYSAIDCERIFNMLNFLVQKKNWELR